MARAIPCGEKIYEPLPHPRGLKKDPAIVNLFDFVESFNSCEPRQANETAHRLAQKYGKQNLAEVIPTRQTAWDGAYTNPPDDITCESDLIRYIKKRGEMCLRRLLIPPHHQR